MTAQDPQDPSNAALWWQNEGEFQDEFGNVLTVGSRCIYGVPEDKTDPDYQCVIYEITEPDGDVDEYGRSIYIAPRVKIRFDTGETDSIQASVNHHQSDFDWTVYDVSDLELVKPFSVGLTEGETFAYFATLAEAEAWIANKEQEDPEGVLAGNYFIHGPEPEKS